MARKYLYLLGISILFSTCQQNPSGSDDQTYTRGNFRMVVDESFTPIIDDQIYVFNSTYPDVKIDTVYKPENELLGILLNDSASVAVMSRTLSPEEAKYYERKKIKIRVNRFAIDGIALVTQSGNPDSLVSVQDIINLMQGKPGKIKNLVFDNPNSSIVRYFKELAQVKDLPKTGVYALKSNPDVIKYVAANPGTIGAIGINWIEQPNVGQEADVAKLKVMGVKNLPGKPGADKYYKPSQNDLALGYYPLIRNLYLINCEGGPGPGTGFVTFVAGERGQRIILKSGLLPDSIPPREVIIRK